MLDDRVDYLLGNICSSAQIPLPDTKKAIPFSYSGKALLAALYLIFLEEVQGNDQYIDTEKDQVISVLVAAGEILVPVSRLGLPVAIKMGDVLHYFLFLRMFSVGGKEGTGIMPVATVTALMKSLQKVIPYAYDGTAVLPVTNKQSVRWRETAGTPFDEYMMTMDYSPERIDYFHTLRERVYSELRPLNRYYSFDPAILLVGKVASEMNAIVSTAAFVHRLNAVQLLEGPLREPLLSE